MIEWISREYGKKANKIKEKLADFYKNGRYFESYEQIADFVAFNMNGLCFCGYIDAPYLTEMTKYLFFYDSNNNVYFSKVWYGTCSSCDTLDGINDTDNIDIKTNDTFILCANIIAEMKTIADISIELNKDSP